MLFPHVHFARVLRASIRADPVSFPKIRDFFFGCLIRRIFITYFPVIAQNVPRWLYKRDQNILMHKVHKTATYTVDIYL